jgi:hypothetical protein
MLPVSAPAETKHHKHQSEMAEGFLNAATRFINMMLLRVA